MSVRVSMLTSIAVSIHWIRLPLNDSNWVHGKLDLVAYTFDHWILATSKFNFVQVDLLVSVVDGCGAL
jgi:hypothetical protein